MKMINAFVKRITFTLEHPVHKGFSVPRVLSIRHELHIPDHFVQETVPSLEDMGFIDLDLYNTSDLMRLKNVLIDHVIRSKVDCLQPDAVSAMMRSTGECSVHLLGTDLEKISVRAAEQYGIRLTFPGSFANKLGVSTWYGGDTNPVLYYQTGEWPGLKESEFVQAMWVSDEVANWKAQQLIADWEKLELPQQPISADVVELCYAKQIIELSSAISRDVVYTGTLLHSSTSLTQESS